MYMRSAHAAYALHFLGPRSLQIYYIHSMRSSRAAYTLHVVGPRSLQIYYIHSMRSSRAAYALHVLGPCSLQIYYIHSMHSCHTATLFICWAHAACTYMRSAHTSYILRPTLLWFACASTAWPACICAQPTRPTLYMCWALAACGYTISIVCAHPARHMLYMCWGPRSLRIHALGPRGLHFTAYTFMVCMC